MLFVHTRLFSFICMKHVNYLMTEKQDVTAKWLGISINTINNDRKMHCVTRFNLPRPVFTSLLMSAHYLFLSLPLLESSTIVSMLEWTNYDNIENARPTGVLFLDLKKVFDTVDHEILLKRLNSSEFSRSVQDWMLSYLSDRSQVIARCAISYQNL